jgi:hypothetical protein
MNRYQVSFNAVCPVNEQIILYSLTIETPDSTVLPAEDIIATTRAQARGLHEEIAEHLWVALGGRQSLSAVHHGVSITTVREGMSTALQDIARERTQQATRFGTSTDDTWSLGEWAALISHYATRCAVGDLKAIDPAQFRKDIVKAGALTVACIEALDRKAAK